MNHNQIQLCAELMGQADGLLVTAGAGMGVDSGLPDFRGRDGFWRAYPALREAGMDFASIASPNTFISDPELAWGFYGHRLQLYRDTVPHKGFQILREFARYMEHGVFIFTSNVDGQFQKAGFKDSEICEVHGSIHHLQCMRGCLADVWPATGFVPEVDEARCLLRNAAPTCPHCGGLARPNILMFGDYGWLDVREKLQTHNLRRWLGKVRQPVVIEIGAGTHIPTARMMGQSIAAPMIRINPGEATVPHTRDVSLPVGALEGLRGIEAVLTRVGAWHGRRE